MDYINYEDDDKKDKKRKKKKKEKKEKVKEEVEEQEENIYSDYLDNKKNIDIDDFNNEKIEYDDIKLDTKEDIINKKKQRKSNSAFYTAMGIIFTILILVVIGLIIYTNYIKK